MRSTEWQSITEPVATEPVTEPVATRPLATEPAATEAVAAEPTHAARSPRPVQDAAAYWLGRVGYGEAAVLQHRLVAARLAGVIPDTFVFLEHPPVVTLGRGSHREHLLAPDSVLGSRGVEVWETTRGGDVTFHGPGQLVGYGIADLRDHGRDVARWLRGLESALIAFLGGAGVNGELRPGLTGVWVGDRKVAALGVRVEKWVTSHGFALNVRTDLSYFDLIVPCGIRSGGVTSLERLAGTAPPLEEAAAACRDALAEEFGWRFGDPDRAGLERLPAANGPVLGGVRRLFPRTEE
jgi:lipoyl(octanoyl) transferase